MSRNNGKAESPQITDYDRWSDLKNHNSFWDSRSQLIARLIPDNASVFEFGAGRRILEKYLKPTNPYTPSDLANRGPGTFICDLNQNPLPSFPVHDIAVFSGVLEYLRDITALPGHLKHYFPTVIASYSVLENNPSIEQRTGLGWHNHYSYLDFIQLFSQCGYTCSKNVYPWRKQVIFVFSLPPEIA